MRTNLPGVLSLLSSSRDSRSAAAVHRFSLLAGIVPLAVCLAVPALSAQSVNRITQEVDVSRVRALPNHHPLWANSANSAALAPADLQLNQLTLVLSRSPEREQAFEQFLADQQNPASPDFHHWLTPAEVGDRFGLSDQDISTITGWLQSQGLQVNWVSPSRIFIGFGGTAADVGHAFQTQMQYYNVGGEQKLSVNSDPMVPAAVLPAIKGIRGLYTVGERPTHRISEVQTATPQLTISGGVHYITPADFNTIYDVPNSYTGAGKTIGIVSWSRTNAADFDNFKIKTGVTFTDPTEVVPTAYGGIDPGPALTAPPSGSSSTLGGQEEATLDVLRAGSVAPGANLLLVVSSASGANDGIGADAQYLVNTTPVPAQVMSISFGACELSAGPSNVAFWDNLFQTAASEGISVFVSSGDSGAAGCDAAFSAPPAAPKANSPNYICSSSYATCVGGTQFADTASPSTYWSSTNTTGYQSALSYIPEGAWNESTTTSVAGTGGGVSTVIPTPSWQTGTGVPSARTGRYTPDVSFTASNHDAYFACLAAANGSCVTSGGSFSFVAFSGTSASAPGMAGVAALLDQKLGGAQGNLNPQIYAIAASAPASYHDTTVASSGVSNCTATTASLCNNSVTNLTGGGAQAGFTVGTGYDEATGLGSLDVNQFLNNFSPPISTPTVNFQLSPSSSITTAQSLTVTVGVSGVTGFLPTGSVTLTSGSYSGAATSLYNGWASFTIAGGALAAGNDTLTANYTPDASSSARYNAASGSTTVTVTAVPLITPTVYVQPSRSALVTAQQLQVIINVNGPSGDTVPTGTVTLTSGTYTSAPANVVGGGAMITIPAQTLAPGTDTLTAVYTPDTAGSSVYKSASGTATVTVSATKTTPSVSVAPSPSSITPTQGLSVGVFLSAGDSSYLIPTGSVTLTSGSYTSAATSLVGGGANINVPPGALTVGNDTLTANYTPDSSSSTIYNAASGSGTVAVSKATPVITWNSPASIVAGTALSAAQLNATASVPGTFVYNPPIGTVMSTVGSATLSTTFTPNDTADYTTVSSSVTLTVTAVVPAFTVAGTAITISTPGATTGNTTTVTVTPTSAFTGSVPVTLTASITSSPAGAQYPPTLSFGSTSPVNITAAGSSTATLTVATTASTTTSCSAANHPPGGIPWYAQGGAVLACVLLIGVAPKRRKWRTMFGALVLLIALAGGMMACGGGSSTACTPTTTPGTTTGSYTITVSATSGSTTANNTIALTVN